MVEKDQELTRELSYRKVVQETSCVYLVCGEIQSEIMLLTRRIKKKGPIGKREGSEWEIFGPYVVARKGVEDHANRKACHITVDIGYKGTCYGNVAFISRLVICDSRCA